MGERSNIAAFTGHQSDYPPYISINREADGRIIVTARECGHAGNKIACVDISERELIKLAHSIIGAAQWCHCGPDASCPVCDPGG